MDKAERNERILNSDKSARELADELGVSRSTVYNVRRQNTQPSNQKHFADFRRDNRGLKGKRQFDQIALSGLIRFGSQIQEEFQRELQDDAGVKIYTEMAVHPVAAAILFAIQMAQRQVNWFVQPASDSDEDKEAAEFVDQSLDDMSQTWDDVVSQVFTMLKYGFATCELVYKRRLGQKPPKYVSDPARSRFSDGLVGWRRWQFISPRSMPASNRWEFDEYGRVQAVYQEPAPDYQLRTIPMEKALLFRTRVEWDNPEGMSILRPMYEPWYYATNLAEVEAIGAERLGLGLPVAYMGANTTTEGRNSDWNTLKDIVRNVRADEQMGIVIPYAKMGSGAPEGEGVLFELVSPPSRGIVDFDKVITRYEQRMAMVVLAQFIFLGMTKVGTQALAESTIDVFQLAITAWSDMLASVVNRFAIPRLMAINPFKLEALPTLAHSDIAVPNLAEVSGFVNQLVGSEVLTPDEQLETYLRELAGLPERADTEIEIVEESSSDKEEIEEESSEQFAVKTILGALGRDEDTGEFKRGAGAALSEEEETAALLGEGLVSGKMTPAQSRELSRLGLVESKDGKTVLTTSGRDLARTLKRKPYQGVAALASLTKKVDEKTGKKRPVKTGPSGKKKGKAKKPKKEKAKKAKGGRSKGGKPKSETKEEKAKLDESKDVLDRLEAGGLSPDMAKAFMLIYSSENPDLAAGEYDEEIRSAMVELGLLSADGKVTGEGKRLSRALENEDWDVIGEMLGDEEDLSDLLDEHFIQRLRQGGPKWERATNIYEAELRRTYQVWADETAGKLSKADDEQDFSTKLDEAVEVLIAALILLGRRKLPDAFQLGLAGVPSSPEGIQELSTALTTNEDYLTNSLSPGILTKMRQRVMDDPLIATDKASLAAVFSTFLARIGSYAGAFWTLVQRGFGDRVMQQPDPPRVRWVLDARAKHCATCLQFGSVMGKVYESYEAMLVETGGALPSYNTDCDGNCRCWLEEEVKPGVWKRM